MPTIDSPLLMVLVPDCCGDRLYEDGYADALLANGMLADSCSYSKGSWGQAHRYVAGLLKRGVTHLIYPTPQSEIYYWPPTALQMLPKRPRIDRSVPNSVAGIVELVALIESAGIRTAAFDMHFDGPFDDFEVTFYGPPERFIGEVLAAFPELAKNGPA